MDFRSTDSDAFFVSSLSMAFWNWIW